MPSRLTMHQERVRQRFSHGCDRRLKPLDLVVPDRVNLLGCKLILQISLVVEKWPRDRKVDTVIHIRSTRYLTLMSELLELWSNIRVLASFAATTAPYSDHSRSGGTPMMAGAPNRSH